MEKEIRIGVAQRYVDILTNGGFKALFGDAANKDVVMSIINVLLPNHRKVTDIEYLPTEHQGHAVHMIVKIARERIMMFRRYILSD